MLPIDLLSPAAMSGQTPSTGEPGDAGLFTGLLESQGASRPRGRLGFGARLAEQTESVMRLEDSPEIGLFTGGGLWPSDQPLVNPGPGNEGKADGPLINPGPTNESKPLGPLINPGAGGQAKTDGPLINSGPGSVKPEAPLVNPGPTQTKPDVPLVLPGTGAAAAAGPAAESAMATALQALSADGQVEAVGAIAQAAQQTVARAPETSIVSQPSAPALDLEAIDPEVILSPQTDGPVAAGGAASSGGSQAGAATTGGAVQGAQPSTGSSVEAVDIRQTDDAATDPQAAEADMTVASAMPEPITVTHTSRADAASVAGRLSFDALAQVSAQIIRRLETRVTRFDIELNPVELGRVDVRLDIDAEGRLAARLAFDNPLAATELRGRVEELRRDLQQAGFQLAEDAFSFTDRGGSDDRRSFDADDRRRAHARSIEAADQTDIAAQPALRTLTRLGLDVRV
ncbi:flagellar hook-length control protein FliK [Brevundimonas aveniformis]|uniref:flagellar hook-length control protein FliK n=1 Tax=Brevundimonas aveniformis TaxID=370977 RepID=UPI00248FC096|nr:flagellar hook-length control protein FliK [Brevundimonas aveniformis]